MPLSLVFIPHTPSCFVLGVASFLTGYGLDDWNDFSVRTFLTAHVISPFCMGGVWAKSRII